MEGRARLEAVSLDLLSGLVPIQKGVRLLGVTLSSLTSEDALADQQLPLAL